MDFYLVVYALAALRLYGSTALQLYDFMVLAASLTAQQL